MESILYPIYGGYDMEADTQQQEQNVQSNAQGKSERKHLGRVDIPEGLEKSIKYVDANGDVYAIIRENLSEEEKQRRADARIKEKQRVRKKTARERLEKNKELDAQIKKLKKQIVDLNADIRKKATTQDVSALRERKMALEEKMDLLKSQKKPVIKKYL